MDFEKIFALVKSAITNKFIIATFIVIFLYTLFCSYVANYVKKPKVPKKKSAPKPPPAAPKTEEKKEGDEEASEQPKK